MLYSKYDNNVDDIPDYVVGNDFSRVGLVKNPIQFGGTDLLNNTTATNLSALVKPSSSSGLTTSNVTYSPNALITQQVGVGSTAVGYVASWNPDTGILKYCNQLVFLHFQHIHIKNLILLEVETHLSFRIS